MKKFSAGDIARMKQLLASSKTTVIVTHMHPDGDALGCTSAMWRYLRQFPDKSVSLLIVDRIPANLQFILGDIPVCSDPEILNDCDLVIVQDLNVLSRTGDLEAAMRACKAPKILIDHHLDPALSEFDLLFSETEISSASELTYWLLRELEGPQGSFPLETLTPLMCGMTTDTNNFANSVFPSTLQMASELLAAGVDREAILNSLYRSGRESRVRAFAYFLGQKLVVKDALAYIVITADDLERYDVQEGELEGMVNVPLEIEKVKISMTAKQDGDRWRISIRSKRGWSANRLAHDWFCGGGHEQASGGRMPMEGETATPEQMAEYIEKHAVKYTI